MTVRTGKGIGRKCTAPGEERAREENTSQNKLPQGLIPSVSHADRNLEFVLPKTGPNRAFYVRPGY